MNPEVKFSHSEFNQNLSSPRVILPILFQYIRPASVIDIGCGTGRFLRVFKEFGIMDVLGVDGNWVNRALLKENIDEREFHVFDLEKFKVSALNRRFDLALCIEVAEHIDAKYADLMVDNLTSASDHILFSAAIPYQGGQHHVNEQWVAYWMEKFKKKGFVFCDVFRDELWDMKDVQLWFKQNLFLVVKKEKLPAAYDTTRLNKNYVHPDLYLKHAVLLKQMKRGHLPVLLYVKLLAKAIAKRVLMMKRS